MKVLIHSEWTDFCIIDENKSTIQRKSIENEYGKYYFINDDLIINWNNWTGNDTFILFDNYYYHKLFFDKYIYQKNIIPLKLYYNNINFDCYINKDDQYIFKKFDIKNIGFIKKIDNKIKINWNNIITDFFYEINNEYYEEKYIIYLLEEKNKNNQVDNFLKQNNEIFISEKNKKKIEIFKKINNKYYLKINNVSNNNLLEIENKYLYKILNNDFDHEIFKNNIYYIINNNILKNDDYLNKNNLKKYIESYNEKDDFYNINYTELNFELPVKNKKRILSLVEWAYPPFGGGENWILNIHKILFENNFENFIICFSDPFKNIYYEKIKLIDLNYVKIIQMPKNLLEIIKLIKHISPDIINHQGVYREFYMSISNILEIPFLTGFCFWQNIIEFNGNNLNVNMINNNNLQKTNEFDIILKYSYTYSCSDFVNDIIYKLYEKKLDVIETISLEEDFLIDRENHDLKKYVTLINCHYNKGGYLIDYLCNNLNINIPLQFIYTENDPDVSLDYVSDLISRRNRINNINILIIEKIDIRIIYKKTKIILIPSICDETFCRVGYEAMINKIPIISSTNGNLKYLLKDYAIFIDNQNTELWNDIIEKTYFDKDIMNIFSLKDNNYLSKEYIEKKILDKINNIHISKYNFCEKNIGLIIPWADQGLGIQGREYYITLKKLGYIPCILSFRPYHATYENIYLQTDKNEWNYENIMYNDNYRETLTYEDILTFIHKYNLKKIIIIEATYQNIFNISFFLKILKIEIFLVINLECVRLEELRYHKIYDKIITNNNASQKIMSKIFNDQKNIFNLGFHLNHPYFKKIIKEKRSNINKLKFFCLGGLNSITRKNIDIIIITFFNIFKENIYLDWELHVYIQGVEIPDIVKLYSSNNIIYHLNSLSYKSIVSIYTENDIFIHMGSHEGLGLGFYESLYCGTPIITMNWIPNNEIIKDKINGWIIDCNFGEIHDNNNSLLNKGIINEKNLKEKIIEILNSCDETLKIMNNVIDNINNDNLYNTNKNKFEEKFIKILTT